VDGYVENESGSDMDGHKNESVGDGEGMSGASECGGDRETFSDEDRARQREEVRSQEKEEGQTAFADPRNLQAAREHRRRYLPLSHSLSPLLFLSLPSSLSLLSLPLSLTTSPS
jgi:hypothetical protein